MRKTSQLQIRVSPEEKATLKRLAGESGQSVSQYVLSQLIPSTEGELDRILLQLRASEGAHRPALTELARLLEEVPPHELTHELTSQRLFDLTPTLLNCVAAMVEQAAHDREIEPPAWVGHVAPLERPHFMWGLQSLRPHQIRVTPVPFKRRNLFFDPAGGPRV